MERPRDSSVDEGTAANYAALLQPMQPSTGEDEYYAAMRRLLLYRQALAGKLRRQSWSCNGEGYTRFRNALRLLKQKRAFAEAPALSRTSTSTKRRSSSEISTEKRYMAAANAANAAGRSAAAPSTPSSSFAKPSTPSRFGPRGSPPSSPISPTSPTRRARFKLLRGHNRSQSLGGGGSPSSLYSPSFSNTSSPSSRKSNFLEPLPAYSFNGMHCIFDTSKARVNMVKFGHLSNEVLAFAGVEGVLYVCSVADPPRILHKLAGHTKEITDFDWSMSNEYLLSSSLDKSLRVWNVSKGECVRIIYGSSSQLCARFHPVNNNFLLVGNAAKELTVWNFSTGRQIHKLTMDRNITALDIDNSGAVAFAGDANGTVHSVRVDKNTGELHRGHANATGLLQSSSAGSAVTCMAFRSFSLLASGPVLLVAGRDGSLRYFSVALEVDGYLSLKCSLQLGKRSNNNIRAAFCPLLSLEKGELIVTGSEDTNIYFYDFARAKNSCVNKLQGHGAPVVDVSWCHGENLLVSCDTSGVVIAWKRSSNIF